ncbi:MAG: hypothetical protein QME45_11225 [Clostridiales bacterium]|nr:hypothetical protein [Clostridiales bacterium]
MRLGIISKISMFLSSYALLFLALAAKYYKNKPMMYMLAASIIGCIATGFIIKTKINHVSGEILSIQSKNEQITSYLVTYLLPFMGFNLNNAEDDIALLIIFIIIGVLYIKADLIYINPVLMILGYNIYDVVFKNGRRRILISKRKLNDLRVIGKIEYYELLDRTIIIEKMVRGI